MAIKQIKTNTELDALFTQLAEPFDANGIKCTRSTPGCSGDVCTCQLTSPSSGSSETGTVKAESFNSERPLNDCIIASPLIENR